MTKSLKLQCETALSTPFGVSYFLLPSKTRPNEHHLGNAGNPCEHDLAAVDVAAAPNGAILQKPVGVGVGLVGKMLRHHVHVQKCANPRVQQLAKGIQTRAFHNRKGGVGDHLLHRRPVFCWVST